MTRRNGAAIAVAATLAGLAAGCSSSTGPAEVRTIEVAEFLAPCIALGPRECMLVRFDDDEEFGLFYDEIVGFEYRPGFRYRLLVTQHPIRNPPADGSSVLTRLIRIESQVASPHANLMQRVHQSEQLWQTSRPASYQMVLERVCFCAPEAVGPVRMRVAVVQTGVDRIEEQVTSLVYAFDDTTVPAQFAPLFPTVAGLFQRIRQAVLDGAHHIDADFDVVAGNPVRVFIDRIDEVADDEVEYEILSLTPF